MIKHFSFVMFITPLLANFTNTIATRGALHAALQELRDVNPTTRIAQLKRDIQTIHNKRRNVLALGQEKNSPDAIRALTEDFFLAREKEEEIHRLEQQPQETCFAFLKKACKDTALYLLASSGFAAMLPLKEKV